MAFFVHQGSIVREIWGKGDTILFVFVGSSAEFALNKAVDWLFFTGRLPADPLGRLFSTVTYAQQIVFSDLAGAHRAIDAMAAIHHSVEHQRGASIPDWAYRDVLYMLIDYSIRAFELLERKLTLQEKEEVYEVFYRMGSRMKIPNLPPDYQQWLPQRAQHMERDLEKSAYTQNLYRQYKKHLGQVRYQLLRQAQVLIVPERVNTLLSLGKVPLLKTPLTLYKLSRKLDLDRYVRAAILPSAYQTEIKSLDRLASSAQG